jgi:hypothetical protein
MFLPPQCCLKLELLMDRLDSQTSPPPDIPGSSSELMQIHGLDQILGLDPSLDSG